MPSYNWGLILLLILAFMAHYATPLLPNALPSSLTEVNRLLELCQEQASRHYQQEVFTLIAQHLADYRAQPAGQGEIGIYVAEIATGFSAGLNADLSEIRPDGSCVGYFHTASVAKLTMAYVFYYLDSLGQEDIWQTHCDPVVGQCQQWQPLIHRMLTHSLNLHYNIMLRYLGSDRATTTLQDELGLTRSTLSRELAPAPGTSNASCWERYGTLEAPRTTPADLGKLLVSLAHGDILTPENNELFLSALTNTIYNSRIPAAIDFAVPVAHKTGTKSLVYNDAALVLLPKNEFVLVLLTRFAPSGIQNLMSSLTHDLYEYHSGRQRSVEQWRQIHNLSNKNWQE